MSEYIPVRFSHLLGYSGVGAIVRGPDSLMIVQDSSKWTDRNGNTGAIEISYAERIRYALEIYPKRLCTPPMAKELKNGQIDGVCIPATRFPRWMTCPKCGQLYPQSIWKIQVNPHKPVCTNPACSKARLEQVQYVMIHPNGYIADLPWSYLAHRGSANCKLQDRLALRIDEKDGRQYLYCSACNAKTIFDHYELLDFGNANQQPWLFEPVPAGDRKGNTQIVKVNDSRVYSPSVASALVIPPESRLRKGTPVDLLYRSVADQQTLLSLANKNQLQRNSIAKKYNCSIDDLYRAIKDIEDGYPYYGKVFSNSKLLEDEYEAFLDETPYPYTGDEDFITHHHSAEWQKFIENMANPLLACRANAIEKLIKVDRIKEVRVFKGFERGFDLEFERKFGKVTVPPDISGQADWLPAIELYGEGIFFTLNAGRLATWERNEDVQKRFSAIEKRSIASGKKEPAKLTARFILLHTLSHLLIRQLEAVGGYPAASLTERIYCDEENAVCPMAGILIYTAVPDKSGTLGGLAELTESKRFLAILSQALDKATWCSSDPVCSEHNGQGMGLLNLAACHGCALVPDTACMYTIII